MYRRGLYHQAHFNVGRHIDGNAVLLTGFVDVPENQPHFLITGRRPVFQVSPGGGSKNTHGRKSADAGDIVNHFERVFNRLEAGNDLPGAGPFSQLPARIFKRALKSLLPDEARLPRTELFEVFGIVKFVAEAEMMGA